MKYGRLPGLDKDISRLVQGGMMLNTKEQEAGSDLFDAVFALGCNTFDTAHVYGNGDCERALGHWINTRGIREQVVVLGKGAHHNAKRKRVTPADIASDIHASLGCLKTEYIDLYLLHRDDPSVPVGPIVEALNEHKEAGRIRVFGASNWTVDRIVEANVYAEEHGLTPFALSSPHFSLAEQLEEPWDDCITITGEAAAEQRAWYAREQFPLFCWSTLAGGWFSGRLTRENQAEHANELYMRCYGCDANWQRLERATELGRERGLTAAQVALAYTFLQGFDVYPLVAAYVPEEFEASAAAADVVLSDGEVAWLDLRADGR